VAKTKVNIRKLSQMLRSGKTVKQCAQFFNVTPGAISQHKNNLNVAVVKNVALENAHRIVDKNLNTISQLEKINRQANKLLDDLEQKPEMKLKIMAEIRGQLRLQLEIFQCLYDMKAIQQFQEEVLTAIREVSPDVRKQIITKLNQRRAIRSVVKFD
jgi:dsDNA-specific endonuclease/ATPase MutS2